MHISSSGRWRRRDGRTAEEGSVLDTSFSIFAFLQGGGVKIGFSSSEDNLSGDSSKTNGLIKADERICLRKLERIFGGDSNFLKILI